MIAFIAITSILNIALGYCLARYVTRTAGIGAIDDVEASHTAAHRAANESAVDAAAAAATAPEQRSEQRQATWVPAADNGVGAAAGQTPGSPASAALINASAAPSAMPNAGASEAFADGNEQTGAAPSEVEEELLAGIEQFRSQLAKIKGMTQDQPTEAPAATPALAAH